MGNQDKDISTCNNCLHPIFRRRFFIDVAGLHIGVWIHTQTKKRVCEEPTYAEPID